MPSTSPSTDLPGAWWPWATWAGEQPWALYALGCVVCGVIAAALVRCQSANDPAQAPSAPARLAWGLAATWVTVLLAAWVVAAVGASVSGDPATPGPIGRWDQHLLDALAPSLSAPLLAVAALVSHAGDPGWIAVVGLLVATGLWRARHRALAVAWVVALSGNALLTVTIKPWWARLRPAHPDGLTLVNGYSFPSGHASASAVCYLWLAALAAWLLPARWRWPAAWLCCGLAWTVAFSRVVLSVHYPSDVAAGLLVGATWALASMVTVHHLLHWRRHRAQATHPPAWSAGT